MRLSGLSPDWSCRPAGQMFCEMAEREAGDPLRINGRTTALFVLEKTPANLAEVQARVRTRSGVHDAEAGERADRHELWR